MSAEDRQNSPRKGKGRLKRESTEAEIIKAFDRVVRRDGLRDVGVNTVIKEAGIGKGLLYNYFGGLPGLVEEWGKRNQIWPTREELLGPYADGHHPPDPLDLVKTVILNHATSLKEHPLRVELLADEMMNPTAISGALSDVRADMGKEHQSIFRDSPEIRDHDNRSLLMVMMAAASYLAMRAEKSPTYMGEQLDTDEGWEHMMQRFERIIELVQLALRIEGVMGKLPESHTYESDT